METKELRIGSYINKTEKSNEDFNDYYIVKNIDYAEHRNQETSIIGCKGNKHGYFSFLITKWKPIELTEEWILMFGFVKGNDYEHGATFKKIYFDSLADYGSQDIVIAKDGNHYLECGYYGNEINCKYVHQLQNLYFILEETELILSNNS